MEKLGALIVRILRPWRGALSSLGDYTIKNTKTNKLVILMFHRVLNTLGIFQKDQISYTLEYKFDPHPPSLTVGTMS